MKYFTKEELFLLKTRVDEGLFYYPKIVKVILLEKCNWRCDMCSVDKSASPKISISSWLEVLEECILMGTKEINFTGGEATLYPNFLNLIRSLKKIDDNVKLKLLTNGSTLSSEFSEDLVTAGIRHFIISLHAGTEKIHDDIVGKEGQFNKTVNGIKNLVNISKDKDIWINFVLQKKNIFELEKFVDLSIKLKVNGISISPIDQRVDSNESLSIKDIDNLYINIFPKILEKCQKNKLGIYPADLKVYGDTYNDFLLSSKGILSRGFYNTSPCFWIFYHITLDSNGEVLPCCNRPLNKSYGNFLETNIKYIINSNKMKEFLNISKNGLTNIDACQKCEMKLQVNKYIKQSFEK